MLGSLTATLGAITGADITAWLNTAYLVIKVIIGFSVIIFVHELGHFLAAKWVGIRVDRFAIGFGQRLFGWRKGEGFTFGGRPAYTAEELAQRGWGETDYCFKLLPVGGYVKMLGQEDVQIDDKTGDVTLSNDPRAFTNKPVGQRMIVVSAGVIFNLIFAFIGFMCVFMMGRQALAPQISVLDPDSPAARAGLRYGDIILAANGSRVTTFHDIILAQVLADNGVVRFKVQRDGKELPDEMVMQIDSRGDDSITASGVGPEFTATLQDIPPGFADAPGLQGGDTIVRVGDEPVEDAGDVFVTFNHQATDLGRSSIDLTVERPDASQPDKTSTRTVRLTPTLRILPATPTVTAGAPREDSEHILGFFPRRAVGDVVAGQPAAKADLKRGDVFVQWGTVLNPLYHEIVDSILNGAGKPIPVVVKRGDQLVELTITPEQPFHLFRQTKPRVGIAFSQEDGSPVVADTAEGTPAAELGLPRGALLLALDGEPVKNWFEVTHRLEALAGKTITVRYRSGQLESEGRMHVPGSVVSALHLSALARQRIVSINGETRTALDDGTIVRLPNWIAVRELLTKNAGQTVVVRYRASLKDLSTSEGEFTVPPDASNADPWPMRIIYSAPPLPFKPLETTVQTSNPLAAAHLGLESTGKVLLEVYQTMRTVAQSLITRRTNTVQYISGPVGIVNLAVDRAKAGFPELLHFLAFLSVNLAVINFIPFPVVDGGLMVFLLIEKIKGKPLSVRTQMVATLVGLATIVLVFLLVTIQDITKFFT